MKQFTHKTTLSSFFKKSKQFLYVARETIPRITRTRPVSIANVSVPLRHPLGLREVETASEVLVV